MRFAHLVGGLELAGFRTSRLYRGPVRSHAGGARHAMSRAWCDGRGRVECRVCQMLGTNGVRKGLQALGEVGYGSGGLTVTIKFMTIKFMK